jgi:branched-chain amino acid transport system substrate-binding protein
MKSATRARSRIWLTATLLGLLTATGVTAPAKADDLTIGITITTTGPAAALGIPEKNTLAIWPETIGGLKVKVIQLDDGGDPTAATTNARRLITEDKVDVILGSSTTPPTVAVANVAMEAGVPHFGLGPLAFKPGQEKWSVVMPQPVTVMAKAIFGHMAKNNVKTVGMIGYADSWGDLWLKAFKDIAEPMGLKLVADERYARADTSVAGQALKIVAAKPDVVLVAASGTGAALPQVALKERGYAGTIYQTHGAVSRDFIRIAGKAAEDVIMSSGPVMVPELQPDSALTKAPGLAFVQAYEAKYGKDSRNQFGGHVWDAYKVLDRIVPVALKSAKPGTPEFREALRKALLSEKDIAGAHGVFNFTETDRYGVDDRARVLLTVKDGNFALAK